MLIIRDAQKMVFEKAARMDFENRMCKHLAEFFPGECQKFDDEGLREEIRYGILQAEEYGIDAERDICIYIDIMFALGRDFDTDRAFPWAREILGGTEAFDSEEFEAQHSSDKADLLYKAAQEHLARIKE